MRRFFCERCDERVAFDSIRCDSCHAELGYVPEVGDVKVLTSGPPTVYSVAGPGPKRCRCLNAAWGCNWTMPIDDTGDWCRSCRLTRGRPDSTDTVAVQAWMSAEAAKRRLVHQLAELGLPTEASTDSTLPPLAFDLVYLPGTPEVTGYLDGVVTLDLTETDAAHSDELRRAFAEPLRSVIGHLRHEIGHHYWHHLVAPHPSTLAAFRGRFGDERDDYAAAIESHHAQVGSTDPDAGHITNYASSHPLEDWAETFAHYLHVHDALGTADSAGLRVDVTNIFRSRQEPGFRTDFARWQRIATAINDVSESFGSALAYPFDPGPEAIDKLAFIHGLIARRGSSGGGSD